MNVKKFKKLPNVEGYSIGEVRLDGNEVLGFVLRNKEGEKRYILRFKGDIEIEDYW